MIKELLLGVLVLNGMPGLVSAQETSGDMAVVDAFAECQAWTATGDTSFTDQWWAIVADEPFQDRQVSILISNKVPLFLSVDVTYADTTDPQSEVMQRQCSHGKSLERIIAGW